MNTYLFQIPLAMDEKMPVYFPYSVGLLWAYAQQFDIIKNNYNLKEIFFLREDPDLILSRIENPSVVGFSCYVWNWNYSMYLAKKIKSKFPNCKIIVGGPHVPVNDLEFFEKYNFCDIAVYREGELTFKEILEELVNKTPAPGKINGIAYNNHGKTIQTSPAVRNERLDDIPSPYLLGIFDGMKEKCDSLSIAAINGLLETNRGCPYQCTFCDWGNGTLGKVKKFDLRRVKKELLWFAKNKIEYIVNCDANFGIYKDRDAELVKFMIKLKKRYGFPKKFDTNWPKNNNSYTVDFAKLLLDEGMLKRFTASIQTYNVKSLIAIKRKNLPEDQIKNILSYAVSKGIHTNVELIMGLPLDTYENFQKDFIGCVDQGAYPSIGILSILPNSEMAEERYRKLYKIETKKVTKKALYIDEQDEFVISTSTMPKHKLERLILYCWFVSQFHFQGYTDVIADFMHKRYNISLQSFYENLMEACLIDNDRQYPNKLISHFKNHFDHGTTAKLDLGIQNMPFHTVIGHNKRRETFSGLKNIMKELLPVEDHGYINDLILVQEASQRSLYRGEISYIHTKSNIYNYIYKDAKLKDIDTTYQVIQETSPIRNYGEFMIQTRFNARFKTKISAISQFENS